MTVPVRAADGSAGLSTAQRGWELAHWAVANSFWPRIERVAYAGHEWSSSSGGSWHAAEGEGGTRSADSDRVVIVTAG